MNPSTARAGFALFSQLISSSPVLGFLGAEAAPLFKRKREGLFPSTFTETLTSSFFLSFFFFLLGKWVRVSEKPTRSDPTQT